MLSSCESFKTRSVNSLDKNLIPIAYSEIFEKSNDYNAAVNYLQSNSYQIYRDDVFKVVKTSSQNLGHLVWKGTRERWKVSIRIGVSIRRPLIFHLR